MQLKSTIGFLKPRLLQKPRGLQLVTGKPHIPVPKFNYLLPPSVKLAESDTAHVVIFKLGMAIALLGRDLHKLTRISDFRLLTPWPTR